VRKAEAIIHIRNKDIERITTLGSRAKNAHVVVRQLYATPITNVAGVQAWSGLSKDAANRLTNDLVRIGILQPHGELGRQRNRVFAHQEYLSLFLTD
jgi:Fic family protein